MLDTLSWTGQSLRLLDQTQLPTATVYVDMTDELQMHDAIRRLVVRGAPAIGVSAAFGVYLGVRGFSDQDVLGFYARLNQVADYLATSRPTAVNLFWAIDRMRRIARDAGRSVPATLGPREAIAAIKDRMLRECLAMIDQDIAACRAIGVHGLTALLATLGLGTSHASTINILTHCNAGSLATVRYGTALAPIYVGAEQGLKFHVYADETRPLLQGSRITAFELQQNQIPVTLICDNMAASVMAAGKIQATIVGADRITANGDTANKIGTLSVAVNARHFGIPFFVAAPTSTVDLSLDTGAKIPIEERAAQEITRALGRQTAPDGIGVFNPAFDVTPASLITAIITEKGIARPDYQASLKLLCAQ